MSKDNGKELRVGGYCRTSGESQRDNTSIPGQKEGIEGSCEANGWRLVRHYVDECKSGAKTEGRDAFKQMLQDAAKGDLDIVMPFDAKRFARDGVDIVNTAKVLKSEFGVFVVDSKGQFDNRTHRNSLRNFLEAGVSEHERLSIMERMMGGRIRKAKAGLPWCGHPPFGRGFRSTGKNQGVWFVDEKGKAMKALLEQYIKGGPLRELAPKYGFYSASHVQRLIHDGQLAAVPYVVEFNIPDIDIHEEVPVPAVPPLISKELERRVLDRLLHNRNFNKQFSTNRQYLLSGFLRCAHCKSSLVVKPRKGHTYYEHHRDTAQGGKSCPFRRVSGEIIEGTVLDYLYSWFVDQPAFDMAVNLALPPTGHREQRQEEARQVRAGLDGVEKEIGHLVNAIAAGADPSLLTSKQDELKARKEALTARWRELDGEIATMPDPEVIRAEASIIRGRLAHEQLGKDWRKESYEDVRRFLHFLFGDNPKKDGLGIWVRSDGGLLITDIRARLRLHCPPIWGQGMLGVAETVATDGEEEEVLFNGVGPLGKEWWERQRRERQESLFDEGEPYGDNS